MLDIDITDPREQRKFGLSTGAIFGVLGLLQFAVRHFAQVPFILWGLAIVFASLGLAAPGALRPVLRVAAPLASGMNWLITRIVLAIAWYTLITPSGILYRLLAGDPLKRAWDAEAASYWEVAEPAPQGLDAFKNQF